MAFSFQFRDHIETKFKDILLSLEFQDLFVGEVATMTLTKEGKW